jgi:hypothetical protein
VPATCTSFVSAVGVPHPEDAEPAVMVTELDEVADLESVTVRVAVYVPAEE